MILSLVINKKNNPSQVKKYSALKRLKAIFESIAE